MDISGEYRIPAPRANVWVALNDPNILKSTISGCEDLVRDGNVFRIVVAVKLGPIRIKFRGRLTLSDVREHHSYKVTGEGDGGAYSFARGSAAVSLVDDGDATILCYTANAQMSGKLAQIGSRLIKGTAKELADAFFAKFADSMRAYTPNTLYSYADTPMTEPNVEQTVSNPQEIAAITTLKDADTSAISGETSQSHHHKTLHPAIWMTGLVAVMSGVLYFFVKR